MRRTGRYIALLAILTSVQCAAQDDPTAWWTFDEARDGSVRDQAGERADRISGNHRLQPGVSGAAMTFDGYTTVLVREAQYAPQFDLQFTLAAWLAPAAYPWNRVPIVSHGDEQLRGYSFELGPRGELAIAAVVDGRLLEAVSADWAVPLREWSHVAARFDGERGLALFVDGKMVATQRLPERTSQGGRVPGRKLRAATSLDLLVGGVRVPRRPAAYHRHEGNQPSWYSLDGLLDELRLYDMALSDDDIAAQARTVKPGPPPLAPRLLPSGPPGPGPFGAYLATLSFYPEWDALWRVGPHADILVRFDNAPVRVVFWRGTQYSPAWVTENGLWMADQSVEGYDDDFTWEHMNDKQNRYSHVRLIEQNDARVVVHWRYAPVNVNDELLNVAERLENGAWIDEYYFFYPDATGVRNVTWKRGTLGSPVQFQESIPLAHPGQRQGDVVNRDYVTVGNLGGETQVFSYVDEPRETGKPVPSDLTIQMHNLKSEFKPFIVFEPGNRMTYLRDLDAGSLSRPGSSSHWPVAQIRSDGRTSQALDRAGSFLGFPISEPPRHRGEDGRDFIRSLYGMTDRPFDELVQVARSWARAPQARLHGGGFELAGFDRSERAYRLRRLADDATLELSLDASVDAPLRNLALLVENWGDRPALLSLNGRDRPPGAGYRFGHRRTLNGTDLVAWIEVRTDEALQLSLRDAPD